MYFASIIEPLGICLMRRPVSIKLLVNGHHVQIRCGCVLNPLIDRASSYTCHTLSRFSYLQNHQRVLYVSASNPQKRSVHRVEAKNQVQTFAVKVVEKFPVTFQPYMKLARIDRPIGSWLLFWPCAWSVAMAASDFTSLDFRSLALCGLGAFVMRGAGCTINDMWDRDIDRKVSRTKDRPLVSGAVSLKDSLIFLSGQLGLGLLILLQFNWYTIVLGASSMGLVVLYPLMKRITHWPQLILGMTFNWGALLGWAAVHGSCNWAVCLPLYTAGVCWTVIYDTIYAHQDKADDVLLGIKSTAIMFGENTRQWLSLFACTMVGGLVLAGVDSDQTWPYYAAVGVVSAHIANQLLTLDVHNPIDCSSKFVSNKYVGLLLFFGIVGSSLLKLSSKKVLKEPNSVTEPKVALHVC